jgi:rhomboid protease GluP
MAMKGKATLGLMLVLVAAFTVEGMKGAIGNEAALLRIGALPNDGHLGHEYWRLITYSLLHLNALHLALNLALLWWVGNIVERRVGGVLMSVAYLWAIVATGLAMTAVNGTHPRSGSSVGASGGVFALLAIALILFHRRDAAHFATSSNALRVLWVVLLGGLGASLLPGVSLTGHLAGLIAGVVAGVLLPLRQTPLTRAALSTPP